LALASGNYWGAALQGSQLASVTAKEIARTAPMWSNEIAEINAWNETHDRHGKVIFLIWKAKVKLVKVNLKF
jgi:hypothetical protein